MHRGRDVLCIDVISFARCNLASVLTVDFFSLELFGKKWKQYFWLPNFDFYISVLMEWMVV